jgi:tagatose 1,6-diphosphate aldolase GatY/KbaY
VSETRFGAVLAQAAAAGRAVGAFTCYDLLGFEAVVCAAEARASPVIVLVGPASFAARGGERLLAALRAAALQAQVPVLIQLATPATAS